MRGRKRRKPLFDVSLDVFHHHDGVVHHDTDGQHQPEQAEGIQREAQQVENAEGTHHRHRHRDQRNDRRAPGLQEQNHHQHDQHHGFQQRLHHRTDRITHEDRRIVRCRPLHVCREARGQFVHFRAHHVRQIDGVRPRRLEDTNPDRVFIVQLGTQGIAPGAHFNPRHVAQADDRTILRCFQDNIAKLFFGMQAPLGVNGDQEVALFRQRLGAKLTGRDLYVLLLHRRDHVRGGQPARRHFIRVQPDAHRVLAGAENLDLADAGQARQLILHLQRGVVAHIQRVVLTVWRKQMHHQRQRGRLLLGGNAQTPHVLRQTRFGLRDAVLHLNLRLIRVSPRTEGHGGHQHAVRARDGFHVHHVLDAVDRLFQRRRHGLGNHFRVGARVLGAHLHAWRHDVRVFAHRQQRDGD